MPAAILLIAAAALAPSFGASASTPGAVTQTVSAAEMFALADRARDRGNAAMAETIYRTMFLDPSVDIRLEARFRLAKLESRRGNLGKAAVLLRRIIDERPGAGPVRLELAQLLD